MCVEKGLSQKDLSRYKRVLVLLSTHWCRPGEEEDQEDSDKDSQEATQATGKVTEELDMPGEPPALVRQGASRNVNESAALLSDALVGPASVPETQTGVQSSLQCYQAQFPGASAVHHERNDGAPPTQHVKNVKREKKINPRKK